MAALCCAGALVAAACASTAPRAELSGTRWAVTTLGGQTIGARAPTIEFSRDRIVGSGGCNRYFGEYAAGDGAISVHDVGSTRMACEPAMMQREAAFFQALAAAQSYNRLGDTLIISDSSGQSMTLRAG
ncbi:MAG TPA: META domain-containing protein [Vitreimonas sp.]|uniref:META domain-containing protein n=1 Tax=Vitreimonas sp. TaxID=3069702 RepID=UPI002D6A3702|nr:META domain-containing protein [Vitreimonas sp.]HYD87060.1 META domain-containing protein [Vitreimonas sp.]